MRGMIVIFAFIVLAGCSTGLTLEQLEAEALISGDWSLVEQREERMARRKQRSGVACPAGSISYCRKFMSEMECSCVAQQSVFLLLGR